VALDFKLGLPRRNCRCTCRWWCGRNIKSGLPHLAQPPITSLLPAPLAGQCWRQQPPCRCAPHLCIQIAHNSVKSGQFWEVYVVIDP